jgi:hypothetical protein
MTSSLTPHCKRAETVARLINRPFESYEQRCWQMVAEIERDLYGRSLPPLIGPPPNLRDRARHFAAHEAHGWSEVDRPEDGAVALMHRAGTPREMLIHAGVFIAIERAGVLHCDDPCGVVFDSLLELRTRRWMPRWFIPRS